MPLKQYPGDKEPRTYTDEESAAIDELFRDVIHSSDTRTKCICACVDIIDANCENPARFCATCRRRNRCHINVKLAHDALFGVTGLSDTWNHVKWKALMKWRQTFK